MAKRDEIIVGLDIGTTKIACIVGEVTEDGVDIIGIGTAPSKGLQDGRGRQHRRDRALDPARGRRGRAHGRLRDHDGVRRDRRRAHRGLNSHGIVAVKDKEVREADIARVIERPRPSRSRWTAKSSTCCRRSTSIDDQDGIREPLGMAGVRLEAKVHIVTASVASAQNIIKCANRCGLQVADIVLEPLASAEAVLDDDEKELGVALIDIGGGTSDIAVFADGAIVHTAVLRAWAATSSPTTSPYGLRTPLDEAERIKHKHGCAMVALVGEDEMMEVPSVGGRAGARGAAPVAVRRDRAARRGDLHARAPRAGEERLSRTSSASGAVITGGATHPGGHARAGRAGARHAGAPRPAQGRRRPRRCGAARRPTRRASAWSYTACKHIGASRTSSARRRQAHRVASACATGSAKSSKPSPQPDLQRRIYLRAGVNSPCAGRRLAPRTPKSVQIPTAATTSLRDLASTPVTVRAFVSISERSGAADRRRLAVVSPPAPPNPIGRRAVFAGHANQLRRSRPAAYARHWSTSAPENRIWGASRKSALPNHRPRSRGRRRGAASVMVSDIFRPRRRTVCPSRRSTTPTIL